MLRTVPTSPQPAARSTARPSTGRLRNERARHDILRAALDLARVDLGTVTVDAIAARAGVGKQTIYRWWPSKWTVILDALLEQADQQVVTAATGPPLERLVTFLTSSFAVLTAPGGTGPLLTALMAHAQTDPDFAILWRERFVLPRRAVLLNLLTGGAPAPHAAPTRADADAEAAVDLLFGGMWYRLLVGHGPLDEAYARRLATAALTLLPTRPGSRPAGREASSPAPSA
jgi:AcrR family transcriptional regulator